MGEGGFLFLRTKICLSLTWAHILNLTHVLVVYRKGLLPRNLGSTEDGRYLKRQEWFGTCLCYFSNKLD